LIPSFEVTNSETAGEIGLIGGNFQGEFDGLIAILRRIDKIVYAGDTEEIRKDLFIPLRELAQDFYLKRREALRYGN
jgi:hypothetical protein